MFGNSNSNQSCLGLFDININNNNNDSDSLFSNINNGKSLFGNINNSNNVFNSLFWENDSNNTQRNSLSGNNKSIESGLLGNGNNNQTNSGFLNKAKNNNSSNKNNNSLFENYNNSNNSLFSRSIITENSLFGNSTNQEKIKHIFHCNYIQFEDPTLDNNKINIFEDNEKNDNHVNTLAKIMEEIEDDENIDVSTIKNQEKQNSTFNNSIINIYNELKYKIPDTPDRKINNGIELLNDEIIEIYKNYQLLKNFKDNKYNICKNCEKNNHFFCEYCSTNLCYICLKDCENKHQNKLIKLKDKIQYYKSETEKLIQEYFLETKEGKKYRRQYKKFSNNS